MSTTNQIKIKENAKEISARLDAIVDQAKQAIGDMPCIHVSRMFYLAFGVDDIGSTPDMVMLSIEQKKIPGIEPAPRVQNYRGLGQGYVVLYKADHKAWTLKAKEVAKAQFEAALKKLKKANVRYRTGEQYGWPIARLA